MIQTAVELKQAIDSIPDSLDAIGRCPLEEHSMRNDEDETDNDVDKWMVPQ